MNTHEGEMFFSPNWVKGPNRKNGQFPVQRIYAEKILVFSIFALVFFRFYFMVREFMPNLEDLSQGL